MIKQPLKLNYAYVDRDKIVSQVEEHFRNSGFGKLIDSKLVSFLVDVFGATAEFIIYYIERRAEEGFFETAKLRSSVIVGSRSLGYSIRRPTPATAGLQFVLRGNLALPVASYTDKTIQFPIGSKMTRNGIPFVLDATYTYKFKAEDSPTDPLWSKTLIFATKETDGTLLLRDATELADYPEADQITPIAIQGESREVTINFTENPISGQIFQRYEINDPEFSDWFGNNDPRAYNQVTGLWTPSSGFTQVSSAYVDDPPYDESSLYKIDRRSLVNHETLYRDTYDKRYNEDGDLVEDNIPRVCVIRTAKSGGVEVMFGDGYVAMMPKGDHVIRIRYLATKGTTANEVGSRGTAIQFVNPIYATMPNLLDISQMLTVLLGTNVGGGADMESIESIKNNAPAIYNSLDRLVGLGDYATFLSSLASPLRVRHAIAWGEQEEVQQSGYRANRRYANHVYYSVLGHLYERTSDGRYVPKQLIRGTVPDGTTTTLNENGLLEGFDYDQYSEQAYFNILVADSVILMREYERKLYEEFFNRTNPPYTDDQIAMVDQFPQGHPVAQLTAMLEARGQLTTKPRYITPIVQEFKLGGQVWVRDFADIEKVRTDVETAIYEFLDANVNFNTPVLISHINSIAKNNPDVIRADLKFIPVASNGMVINDWMTEPEMMSQIPYEYDRFFALQNGVYPDVHASQFTVIPDSEGKITQDGTYTVANYNELIGKKLRLSQDGGVNYFFGEITEMFPTQSQINWYCQGYADEVGLGGMNPYAWYVLRGTIPSGFPSNNQPPSSYALVQKVWQKSYNGSTMTSYAYYQFHIPTVGSIISVAPYGLRSQEYIKWTGTAWETAPYDPQAPIRISFTSDTGNLGNNLGLIAEVVTNMVEVYNDLGFDPKVYLVEAFQTAITKEVKRLFDVIHHKYCSCPTPIPTTTVPTTDPVAEACTPFGLRDHIPAPYKNSRGTDCHESIKAIPWGDWANSYYYDLYQDWTRCGELFPLTKDEWSNGKYNALLDITEFERVTATGTPWRMNAPIKGEADEAWVTESKMHHRIGGISERWFYHTVMRNVIIELRAIAKKKADTVSPDFYTTDRLILNLFLNEFGADGSSFNINDIKDQVNTLLQSSAYLEDTDAQSNVEKFIKSNSFKGLMLKLHNGLTQAIRAGMLDSYGNIVNYTMRNEIVQIKSEMEFRYG